MFGRPSVLAASALSHSTHRGPYKTQQERGNDLGLNHSISRVQVAPPTNSNSSLKSGSSGGNPSSFTVLSQPKTALPPAPTPQKGEKPVGKLQDKRSGKMQDIYKSFVTPGLWWFNGATPTLPSLYPTSANIPLAGLGKGKFTIKVVSGQNKVGLNGAGATLVGNDLKDVTITPKAPSDKAKDVKVEVGHQAPGATTMTVANVELEVRAPHHLTVLGTDHTAQGSHGFHSLTWLRVFDNFGKPMPFIDVNEDFGSATLVKGASSEWKTGFAARTKGSDVTRNNAVFGDQYAVGLSGAPPKTMTPTPSNPKSPLGSTKVGTFQHDWYVGSSTVGKGVHVSRHTGLFYSDHGEYTAFASPPTAAKAPAKKSGGGKP